MTAVKNALDMVRLYLLGDEEFLGQASVAPVTKKWWQKIIPVKGDTPGEVARKLVMILCIVVFLGALGYIADYFYQSYMNRQRQEEFMGVFHQEVSINERFKNLLAINPDTVGWLTVPNTKCDNPVVQTTNNNKYLDTTFEGEKSKYGTLFADKNCKFTAQGLSQNTIVYGHHMRDGTMFGELKKYRKFEFYKENPVLQFTYLYDTQTVDWKVLAVFIIDAQDNAGRFFRTEFTSERQFLEYYNEIRQCSIINTGVDVKYSDQLLTLCTCTYEFDDARLLVVARRVRDGESSQVDVSKSSINQDVVYPEIYYKKTHTTGRTEIIPYVDTMTSHLNSSTVSSKLSSDSNSSSDESNSNTSNGGGWSPNYSSGGESTWVPDNGGGNSSQGNNSSQNTVTKTNAR
jgi:sortase B